MNVGIDVLETQRFSEIANQKQKMNRIFTENEQNYFLKFHEKLTHIAGHFCAKEAVSKALKTGLGKEITLLDIEILHDKKGAPYINIENDKLKYLLNNRKMDISISHTDIVSTAICVIY